MEKIDEKISDAQDRRALLVAERDAAIIAGVEGDTKATAKADQLDKQITTVDRELERLGIARANAARRVDAENAAEEADRRKERIAARKAAIGVLRDKIDRGDKKVAELREALAEMDEAARQVALVCDVSDVRHELQHFAVQVPFVVSDRLAGAGYYFKRLPFKSDRQHLADYIPDDSYLFQLVERDAE